MKVKVIDLLNKIANGEEVPNFKYYGGTYIYDKETGRYWYQDMWFDFDIKDLNDEVEIIEEDKEIEKLDVIGWNDCIHEVTHTEKRIFIEINKTQTKLNEIIDYLMENKQ